MMLGVRGFRVWISWAVWEEEVIKLRLRSFAIPSIACSMSTVAKKETPLMRAERLQRKATELHNREMLRRVIDALKKNMAVVPSVARYLVSLKVLDQGSMAALGVLQETVVADLDVDNDDELADLIDPFQWNKNITTYRMASPKMLKHWLSNMEPAALSLQNLKTLRKAGAREPSREDLLELLEFAVDLEASSSITQEEKVDGVLTLALTRRSEECGRRCQQLVLPPVWARDGFFHAYADKTGEIQLVDGLAEKQVPIGDVLKANGADVEDLSIDQNFSRLRAVLKVGTKLLGRCGEFFTEGAPKAVDGEAEALVSFQTPLKHVRPPVSPTTRPKASMKRGKGIPAGSAASAEELGEAAGFNDEAVFEPPPKKPTIDVETGVSAVA